MLVNGKIPVGTPCPFREKCGEALNGNCGHTGEKHTVAYSCGYARLFNMLEKKMRGFTLIELMIVICIIGIIGAIALPVIIGSNSDSSISFGINGMTESRCIEGYKFVIGEKGHPRQILDEFGKGVKCERNM